jgi:hypothetical protein
MNTSRNFLTGFGPSKVYKLNRLCSKCNSQTWSDGLRESHTREGPEQPEHPLLAPDLLTIKAPLQRSPRTAPLQIPQGISMEGSPTPSGSGSGHFEFGDFAPAGFAHTSGMHPAFSNASAGGYVPQQRTNVPEISGPWNTFDPTNLQLRPQSHLRSRSADSVPRMASAPDHYTTAPTAQPPMNMSWIPEMSTHQYVQQQQPFHPAEQYNQWAHAPQDGWNEHRY